jgi:excisionase family DNA binding protein
MSTLFNTKEAGARLRISESTVRRLFRRHQLKGSKVGRGLVFTEAEILAFIESHREQVEPEQQQDNNYTNSSNSKNDLQLIA